MPKANKKRGRRAEIKRRIEEEHEAQNSSKRQKLYDQDIDSQNVQAEADDYAVHVPGGPTDRPFYGLLDDEEQEYFRKAGELLELNQFSGPDDRHAFVESVYTQADGKELKLANSQSCSRVLERLIQLSSPAQLKKLFQKFSGK
jgi:nucleolar protein 9